MKKVFSIARIEILNLFFSPVAWLVLCIFIVQCGITFFGMMGGIQEGLSMNIPIDRITYSVFAARNALFDKTQQTLYLYIPLLTMGLISREISSGSIKLLLSSPVRISTIIAGKYLAIVFYGFLLVLIIGLYGLLGCIYIQHADAGLIISGITGMFLLICTYGAIGLFMSSLTAYQVVAAISTLAVLAVLNFVGGLWQEMDFVRDLTYFLSLSGRTHDAIAGLLTSKDILYFLLIIALFIGLTIFQLQFKRIGLSLVAKLTRYAMLIAVVLLAGYVSSRPGNILFKDLTATQSNTLTPNSRSIAEQFREPLTVTTYVNLLDDRVYFGLPAARNADLASFDAFRRFIPGMQFRYVYYYHSTPFRATGAGYSMDELQNNAMQSDKEKAAKKADNMGLDLDLFQPPSSVAQRADLRDEQYTLVRSLTYNGHESKLRFFDGMDQYAGEAEISATLKRLLVKAPLVVFTTGNGERSIDKGADRNYSFSTTAKNLKNALVNQGFDVVSLDLRTTSLPPTTSIVVVADPQNTPDSLQTARLHTYIENGGNLLVMGEPAHIQAVNNLLQPFGTMLKAGTIVHPGQDNAPALIFGHTQSGRQVAFPEAAALSFHPANGFIGLTMAYSPDGGWLAKQVTDSVTKMNSAAGDSAGVFPVVVALTREKNNRRQRVIVSGDADFMNNAEISHPRAGNEQFTKSLFSWLCEAAFPVDVSRPPFPDDQLHTDRRGLERMKKIYLGGIPLLVAGLGAFLLMRRRRY